MIDRKQLILVKVSGQASALFDRSDWSMIVFGDGDGLDSAGVDELELSSGQRAGCYGELPEDWNWASVIDYLRRRFAIPRWWIENGKAMVVPPDGGRTVEATTYEDPGSCDAAHTSAIDVLGNHYRCELDGDGELIFISIPNVNLTTATT